ncbi:hypothetical protein J3459_008636 [Metarhizium acridum]|uniref:uncharacterized protein n=1 Tax=Metarhizium acridum TaxID=92637 RepID=UPI001C6B5252|nr:hypothetical protein J3458_002692 [Metarhizium acridum]KAG8425942.1 hypothetical protein J3459_008636 [Metarhizium acridum]
MSNSSTKFDRTPEALETLYERVLDDVLSAYRREAARILRIVAIVPFPLDIDLLSMAVEDHRSSSEPGISMQDVRSDLHAINARFGCDKVDKNESAKEEWRLRATIHMNSRCGVLLSLQNRNDVCFFQEFVRSFLSEPRTLRRLIGGLTDTSFDPPINLLSACIIRLKQNLDDGWQREYSTVDYKALVNLVTADIENGPGQFYSQISDGLTCAALSVFAFNTYSRYRPAQPTNSPGLAS